jgi:hypothetical protein
MNKNHAAFFADYKKTIYLYRLSLSRSMEKYICARPVHPGEILKFIILYAHHHPYQLSCLRERRY